MEITTLFPTGSPELSAFVQKNQVGAPWGNSQTITAVNIDPLAGPNPFDGSPQTKVTLIISG